MRFMKLPYASLQVAFECKDDLERGRGYIIIDIDFCFVARGACACLEFLIIQP